MAACVRRIFEAATSGDFEVLVSHRPGVELEGADALYRACLNDNFKRKADLLIASNSYSIVSVSQNVFNVFCRDNHGSPQSAVTGSGHLSQRLQARYFT